MFAWFNFAHHPLCKNYNPEVFQINGMYFCKGCSEVYGSSFFVILFVAIFNPISYLTIDKLLIIAFITISPSLIGNFIHFKKRIVKDAIRIILGIGLGIGLSELVVVPDLVFKILIAIILLIFYYTFKFTHSRISLNYHSNLCPDCKQFNDHACKPYKQVFATEGEYSRLLSDFIQKRLTINKIESLGFKKSMQE